MNVWGGEGVEHGGAHAPLDLCTHSGYGAAAWLVGAIFAAQWIGLGMGGQSRTVGLMTAIAAGSPAPAMPPAV